MNFNVTVKPTSKDIGSAAAKKFVSSVRTAIEKQGNARVVLATGASQFDVLSAVLEYDLDWGNIEVFHLDEYIGLAETHPASFRKYLTERFLSYVNVKAFYPVDGVGDVAANIARVTEAIRSAPIDVSLIGIGENSHIAFNDPPANFNSDEAYIVVELEEKCKLQQVGEGWFPSLEDMPKTAITMTVRQILSSKTIVSVVPYAVKANAVRDSLLSPVNPNFPASILKTHPDWHLYLDADSAAEIFRL